MTAILRSAFAAVLLLALAGCASTTTSVNGSGSEHGMGGSATIGTGIKF